MLLVSASAGAVPLYFLLQSPGVADLVLVACCLELGQLKSA